MWWFHGKRGGGVCIERLGDGEDGVGEVEEVEEVESVTNGESGWLNGSRRRDRQGIDGESK